MTASELHELHERLAKYGQEHLLRHWHDLSDEQRRQLRADIDDLNLAELADFYARAKNSLNAEASSSTNGNSNGSNGTNGGSGDAATTAATKLDDRLQPIPDTQLLSAASTTPAERDAYVAEGLRQIAAGRVGVVLMAGGQGTRLGFAHPKGMFNVGLSSQKTLFQIQAERLLRLQRMAADATGTSGADSGRITWYIMTSEHTREPTLAFFRSHKFFGLRAADVVLFEQGSLPCFGFDGRILLDDRHKVSRAPDGNGGIYRALRDQGMLRDMQSRGIEYLHAHSVDNILIKVADPLFVGYCVTVGSDCAAKVVEKSQPNEAVGVICIVDGQYQVVEYSEISAATAERRRPDGRLTFSAGNICNHFFTREFLDRIGAQYERQLKLHVAVKKIPCVDGGAEVAVRSTPEKPNGIKIEKFVFDVFQFARKFVAVSVERDEEFSPLKNADAAGRECARTARADVHRLHRRYVEAAGGRVEGGDGVVEVEISPLLSYAGEGLEELVKGKTFVGPVLLKSSLDALNGRL